jgi:hypothetical protein
VIPSGEPPPTAGDRASSDHNTIFRVSFDLSGSLEKQVMAMTLAIKLATQQTSGFS